MRTWTPFASMASCSERVDDGGEHAGVVGGGAVEAGFGGRGPAEEVAAPDDDGHFEAGLVAALQLAGDVAEGGGVKPEGALAQQSRAAELEQDSLFARGSHVDSFGVVAAATRRDCSASCGAP